MHELSIALSIVEMAQEEAEKRGASAVSAVHLKLGALSGVVADALLSSYEMAICDTPLQGSLLLIEDAPVTVRCSDCGGPQPVTSIQHLCCPQCGMPAVNIVSGREIEVVALEIVQ